MHWLELAVEADSETVDPIADVFQRYGGRGVVIEQEGPVGGGGRVLVKTYLPEDDSLSHKRSQIDVAIRLLALICPLGRLQERRLSEEDWARAWRRHFKVLHIGRRLVICPTWLRYSPRPDEVIVRLDPGMAFGTGLHPTTQMCLELLERLVQPGMKLLDLGAGSGILAIAAVKLGAGDVRALDVDPVAARVARENVRINGVEEKVEVREGTLSGTENLPPHCYDLVVANITSKAISDLAPAMIHLLRPRGQVIASGILDQQVEDLEESFSKSGARIREVVGVDDWRALVIEKASP